MKFIKSRKSYEASNCVFNVDMEEARSYRWWIFVKRINGKLVFNNYRYSPSTGGHQRKVRQLLDKLQLKIDAFIEAPQGLQEPSSAVRYYENQIENLKEQISRKGTKKAKNEERQGQIDFYKGKIEEVKELFGL
jgi:hypothetical protein